MKTKAWVLRLKNDFREDWMEEGQDYYLNDKEEDEFLTDDLQQAVIIKDKEVQIQEFKDHENYMIERFGDNAICNFGYTNIMKHFEFVHVDIKPKTEEKK